MDFILRFGVANGYNGVFKKTGGVKTLLPVIVARVLNRKRWAIKDMPCIGKIKAVLFKVALSLGFVPSKVHGKPLYI